MAGLELLMVRSPNPFQGFRRFSRLSPPGNDSLLRRAAWSLPLLVVPLSGALLEKLPTRPKLRQSCRAGGLLLQQSKAGLDDLDLAEAEGLAEAVKHCLNAVIEAH